MPAEPRNVDLKAATLVTLPAFLWGGNPIAIKTGLADAPPIRQAWMRFILGGVTVLAWARATRTSLYIERREVRPLLLLGLMFTVQIALMNLGQGVIVAGFNFILDLRLLKTYKPNGLAAYYLTTPIFGVLQSWLVLGEAITIRLMVSTILVMGGIALASRPSREMGRSSVVASSLEEM